MSNIAELSNIPDISFTYDTSLQAIRDKIVSDYTAAYTQETGTAPSIQAGSPERIMLYSFAAQFYQAMQYIERAGKMGLLKWSEGDFLDNLGAIRGVTRKAATAASCTVQFTLSDARNSATGIPGGTRLAAGDVYFSTDEYLEIPAGSLTGTVTATAQNAGVDANGVAAGELTTIVDPVAYVAAVVNTTTSVGGAEIESDDDFTYRIYMASAGYSTAGSSAAYVYHAKQARSDIGDVVVYSPEPDKVNVVFTLEDGSLPDADAIAAMEAYLSADDLRPLTDQVTAQAPTEVDYTIGLTYYINRSDATGADSIQAAVTAAVTAYQTWQRKVGRDITPSKLIQLVMDAGAKRVEVTAPTFAAVGPYNIAKAGSVSITYGGLEDD